MTFSKTLLLAGTILSATLATPAAAQSSASPFTAATRYDAMGRVTGTISPDPDGSGPLPFRAVRNTYDAIGRLTKMETGTLSSWQSEAVAPASWSGFTVHQVLDSSYDAMGRKLRDVVSASGTTYGVTQISYDSSGRPACTTARMNPAAFSSLPTNACTLGTEGTFGPDRITRNIYDAASQRVQLRVGVGTSVEAADATWAYNLNGQVSTLVDGNGNRAELRYDGHQRQDRWTFPSATAPGSYNDSTAATALATAGSVNANDYEGYGYDANGNRTSKRLRDGNSIAFTFDALNRNTFKNLPGSEPDVTYSYDLLGRMTGASQTGNALTFTYDGFGRQLTQTGPLGTISSTYDAAGRRTSMTHPSGFATTYAWLVTGEMLTISQPGAGGPFDPPVALITFGYDSQGRRTSIARANGAGTSYGYDAVSRLASLSHDMSGTTRDVTFGYSYNPASQIVSRTSSNDAYSAARTNANVTDTHNGLNQLTATGSTSISHDAKGNTTFDPQYNQWHGYSSENLLTTTGGSGWSGTLLYDPLMRLADLGRNWRIRMLHDGQQRVAHYDAAGTQTYRFVFGPGIDEPLIEYSGTGLATRQFLHADERGSIVGTSNDAGTSTAVGIYDDYGAPLALTGWFAYAGQPYDSLTDLMYSRARFYNMRRGRFMQGDPIAYRDQINLYTYVSNDAINRIDPTGLYECQGSSGDCRAIKEYINNAYEVLSRLDESAGDVSSLKEALNYLGQEGDNNGVTIISDRLGDDILGRAGIDTIRIDISSINRAATDPAWRSYNPRRDLRMFFGTTTVIHEATHGADFRRNGMPLSREAELASELRAYTAQQSVHMGMGVNGGLWMPDMSKAEMEARVRERANGSTEIWCRSNPLCN